MSAFRFRAQAALDLRRRELQAAQRELARAEHDRDLARVHVVKATQAVTEAQRTAAEQAQSAGTTTDLQRYRFWIVRLDHERRSAHAMLAGREAEVGRMSAACLYARQRCESLERLRDKTRMAHDRAEEQAERKMIDELATMRFNAERRL